MQPSRLGWVVCVCAVVGVGGRGWRGGVQFDTAIRRLQRLHRGQVDLCRTSLAWRCDVLMTLGVSDLPPWEDLKTMPMESSDKTSEGGENRETVL